MIIPKELSYAAGAQSVMLRGSMAVLFMCIKPLA
jgi:hypothetical protein